LLLCLLAPGHELLQGGRGHVHCGHRDLVSHRSDRFSDLVDEDARQQAHHHGWAAFRDAAADVVRVRLADLDDVGRWTSSFNI